MLTRNMATGQISGEVFKISQTEVFTVSKHQNKASADKVIGLMRGRIIATPFNYLIYNDI